MLPTSYFDRLTQAMGVRTDRRGGERRKATRIPASFRPEVFPVRDDKIMPPGLLRARDVSASGVGLLLTKDFVAFKSVIIRVRPKNADEEYVMLCALKRIVRIDAVGGLGGFSIERLLYPGQTVAVGGKVSSMLWVDVSGDTVGEDPFIENEAA